MWFIVGLHPLLANKNFNSNYYNQKGARLTRLRILILLAFAVSLTYFCFSLHIVSGQLVYNGNWQLKTNIFGICNQKRYRALPHELKIENAIEGFD